MNGGYTLEVSVKAMKVDFFLKMETAMAYKTLAMQPLSTQ
jgi:hypothetical protein